MVYGKKHIHDCAFGPEQDWPVEPMPESVAKAANKA
jgi:hypothetical protein